MVKIIANMDRLFNFPKIKKYVLTGGPCVGKTTVIDILAKRGNATFPEFARAIINREVKNGSDILPWKNAALFQDSYAKEQLAEELEIEKYLAGQNRIFMDRCIIDGRAFCNFAKVSIPDEIDRHVAFLAENGAKYDVIFMLDPLDAYHFDDGRVFKPEESQLLHDLVAETYAHYGYTLIRVPFLPPEARADFILEKVREFEENKIRK